MSMLIGTRTGPATQADGVGDQPLRQGRNGELIISNARGFYYEGAKRGATFGLCLAATTTGIAAGNISAAAAAASTNFALWNPVGSGVDLVLLKVWIGIISGTPTNGPMIHNYMLNGIPSIQSVSTNGAALNNYLGGGSPKARYVAVAAGTNLTGGGLLTAGRQMSFSTQASAFSAAAEPSQSGLELLDGDIVIPPGTGWVPCWAAAGSSLLSAYGVTWEEIAV